MTCTECNDTHTTHGIFSGVWTAQLCTACPPCTCDDGWIFDVPIVKGDPGTEHIGYAEEGEETGYTGVAECPKCGIAVKKVRLFNKAKFPGRNDPDKFTAQNENQTEVFRKLFIWAKGYALNGPGWILRGPNGTGKSQGAVASLRPLVEDMGLTVRVSSMANILDEVRREFGGERYGGNSVTQYYHAVQVLCVEELRRPRTDWQADIISTLIEERYAAHLTTCFTTNMDMRGIDKHFGDHGPRLVSRLREMAAEWVLEGKDLRQRGGG